MNVEAVKFWLSVIPPISMMLVSSNVMAQLSVIPSGRLALIGFQPRDFNVFQSIPKDLI